MIALLTQADLTAAVAWIGVATSVLGFIAGFLLGKRL
jgi:hypothetical protein